VQVGAEQRTGKVLQGRYKILSVLAEGGMGVVYRAERVGIGRPVVVKFLHTVLTEQPGIVDRFEREARATARLNHPNCVALIDYGIEEGSPYLVMEFAEGKTLADLLDFGALSPRRAVRVAIQVLGGLSHAHERGILHRDLKPANIMVCDAVGQKDFVKILDFGLAKLLNPIDGKRDVTVQGIAIGTPGYMSPEQAAGLPSDRRADIYCTGALLYHLVTGQKPFEGDDIHSVLRRHREETPQNPRELKPASAISKELEQVIVRSMQREAAKRYQTAEEMVDALKATPEGRGIQQDPDASSSEQKRPTSSSDAATRAEAPSARRPVRKASRSVGLVVAGLALGAAATVGVALYTPFGDRLQEQRSELAQHGPAKSAAKPADKPAPIIAAKPVEKPVEKPADPPVDKPADKPAPIAAAPSSVVATLDKPIPIDKPVDAKPPEVDPMLDDADSLAAKADDGSGEDDRATPPEVPAVPKRDMPQVRTIADVKQLLKKGDNDGALAALYKMRQKKPTPSAKEQAQIATIIGNLYFDRRWWTDALREYRFACRLDEHSKRDRILIDNTVRTLADHGTFLRARRLLLDYIGRGAIPALKSTAKNSASGDLRRRAQRVLESLEAKQRTASRKAH
jgi:serine/threonine-protein kinase